MTTKRYVIALGALDCGFRFVGPFDTVEAAASYERGDYDEGAVQNTVYEIQAPAGQPDRVGISRKEAVEMILANQILMDAYRTEYLKMDPGASRIVAKCRTLEIATLALARQVGGDWVSSVESFGSDHWVRHCGECGEWWPCSDSERSDINPVLRAKHHVKQDETAAPATNKGLWSVTIGERKMEVCSTAYEETARAEWERQIRCGASGARLWLGSRLIAGVQ
jgi:hypothetical protein